MMRMEFLPVKQYLNENPEFVGNPDCQDTIHLTIKHYQKAGFQPPWIGYYASLNNKLVGAAAFVSAPVAGEVEIAYGVFPRFQHQGIGIRICGELVLLAQKTDPSLIIIAHTLTEENYSTKILRKNGFVFRGYAMDEDEGQVWEWEYRK